MKTDVDEARTELLTEFQAEPLANPVSAPLLQPGSDVANLLAHVTQTAPIPFNRFCKVGTEFAYIQQAIDAMHVSGDGRFTAACHEVLEASLGVPKALLTTSCTHALELAALLLDIKPGDEVIVPSFTFVSTANAFVLRGVRPIFADIRPDTLNLDETRLERLITPRTRAIVPVHYAGVGCEMDTIMEIATRRNVAVVEDNAHGLYGLYRNQPLGTFGSLAALSFHETKNFTCGEGGALLINAPQYVERAEIVREKGTNRKRFFRGEVDRYSWVDIGSSYLLSEILAAVLYAQLEERLKIQAKRKQVWEFYQEHLDDWAAKNGVGLPYVPSHCQSAYHLFYILLRDGDQRQKLIDHLKERRIFSVFHYQPLHLSEMGRQFGGVQGDCPMTESVSERLLRLPFYNGLDEADLTRVVNGIRSFRF